MQMAQQYSVDRGEAKLGPIDRRAEAKLGRYELVSASEPMCSSAGGRVRSTSSCLSCGSFLLIDSRPSTVFSSQTNRDALLA